MRRQWLQQYCFVVVAGQCWCFLGSNSVFAEAAEKAAEQQRWWMLVTATKLESNMSAVVLVVLNAAALLQVEAVVPSEFMSTTELLVEAIL